MMKPLIIACLFSSVLFGNSEPKGAYITFKEELSQTSYIPTKKGVLDGNRKPPEKITYTQEQKDSAKKIEYLIVILQENWSFDSLYGKFPGANGLNNASKENFLQTDLTGKPYATLLTCVDTRTGRPFKNIPTDLPNAPFDLSRYFPMTKVSGSALHHFYQEQYQINGGKMDRFAAFSTAGGFVMSYYNTNETEMAKLAKEYVLCDQFFHSCYGGSTLGALWLFTAQMPKWSNAPEHIKARLYPSGILIKDGLVSSDGYAINDAEPFFPPYKKGTPDDKRMPPQKYPTIGDRLSEKHISWKWYAEGWDNAVKGRPDPSFPFHHQAPVYFPQFGPKTKARKEHLADLKQFSHDLDSANIPSVSFIRSLNSNSEHPGDAPLLRGLNWCAKLIKQIQQSPLWEKCAIIVTYDENGGRWDHVSPPVVDRWGPGTRIPAIIIGCKQKC